MRLSEIRPCDNCGQPLCPTGIFTIIRVTRAMLRPEAAQQTLALNAYFGGCLSIAEALSPDPDCIVVFGDQDRRLMTELLLCDRCLLYQKLDLPVLLERVTERQQSETGER